MKKAFKLIFTLFLLTGVLVCSGLAYDRVVLFENFTSST
jgi:hypothetical protein